MLEKVAGNFNVKMLRIILLLEADFNSNKKWLGHAVMLHMEKLQLMAEEQYGTCKQRSAISQCLNKHLLYDIFQFEQQPATICYSNMKSCYNQIVLQHYVFAISARVLQPFSA